MRHLLALSYLSETAISKSEKGFAKGFVTNNQISGASLWTHIGILFVCLFVCLFGC